MTDPRELQAGDIVEVHTEALSDALWRVSDTDVEDIGIGHDEVRCTGTFGPRTLG